MIRKFFSIFLLTALVCIPMQILAQSGSEKRIAIMNFDSARNVSNWWSSYSWGSNFQPGDAISAALTSRLANSSKFLVVERESLDVVLQEQNLGASGDVTPETAAEVGKLIGAKYIVLGTVTEFNLTSVGSRGSIRLPISGSRLGLGGKSSDVVRISCEIRVVDTDTGLIVYTSSARKEIGTGSSGLEGFYKGYAIGGQGGELPSSGLGKGIYDVAGELASNLSSAQFKETAPKPKLEGYVLYKDGDKVFLNFTSKDRVSRNMIFKIFKQKQIKDPRSGQMRTISQTVGEVKVLNIDDSAAECQIISGGEDIEANDYAVNK